MEKTVGFGDKIGFIHGKPRIGTFKKKTRLLLKPQAVGQRNPVKEGDKIMVAVRPVAYDFKVKIDLGRTSESEEIHFPFLRPGFFLVAVLAQFLFALVLVHLLLALLSRPRHKRLLLGLGDNLVQRVFNDSGGPGFFKFRNELAHHGFVNNSVHITPAFLGQCGNSRLF